MELTDIRPSTNDAIRSGGAQPTGLAGILGSGDHKVIGRMFIATSFLMLGAAEVLNTLLHVDYYSAGDSLLFSIHRHDSLFTLQNTAIVYLSLIPLLLGIALVVVPLQIGSRSIAFPRGAAAAYWGYLVAGVLLIVSYLVDGGPYGTNSNAVDLWLLSFILLVASLLLGAIVVVTTVFTQRAPGMIMTRIPLLSWSMVVAGLVWILTLPVLAAMLVLTYVDHHYGGSLMGTAKDGTLYQSVLWSLRQPQIYAVAIPVLGILGDVATTACRVRNDFRNSISMTLIGLFGFLGFGAFTVTMYQTFPEGTIPATTISNPVVIIMSILVVLPVLGMFGQLADSLRRGRHYGKPVGGAALPLAASAMLLLLIATVVGAFSPIERFHLQGTLYMQAQFSLVTGAAAIGAFAGLFYWASKIIGSRTLDVGGYTTAVFGFLGTVTLGIGGVVASITGNSSQHKLGSQVLNTFTAIGAAGLAGSLLIGALTLLVAIRGRHSNTPADVWEVGQTLEWATASPPSYENFLEVPPVRSEAPLADLRDDLEVAQ